MLYKLSLLKRILRRGALKLLSGIENNNNCDFSTNGEIFFLNQLFTVLPKIREVVIFDVGANVGAYSELLLEYSLKNKINQSLHLFEPTSKCFETLESRFGSMDRVFLNRVALSNVAGKFEIYYDQEKSGLASLHKRNLKHYNIAMSETETVETICAETYIDSHQIKHIDFLKIDIEGHELKAFEGFGKYFEYEFIDFIQFEYGGANLDSHSSLMEIYELLESKNFTVAKLMPNGLEIRKYQPFMENFSYANYVAISNKIVEELQ